MTTPTPTQAQAVALTETKIAELGQDFSVKTFDSEGEAEYQFSLPMLVAFVREIESGLPTQANPPGELPPLPVPAHTHEERGINNKWEWNSYSTDQMTAYARAALAAQAGKVAVPLYFTHKAGNEWHEIDAATFSTYDRANEKNPGLYRLRKLYAAPLPPAKAQGPEWSDTLDCAAWMLEVYEKHLYDTHQPVEEHPYIPSIGEVAAELRAMLTAAPSSASAEPFGYLIDMDGMGEQFVKHTEVAPEHAMRARSVIDLYAAPLPPVPAKGAAVALAYVVWGINAGGQYYPAAVKLIAKNPEWQTDDNGLGEYWAGNDALATPQQPEGAAVPSGDTLADFEDGQWWMKELDAAVSNGTPDQKRAVAVVRNLLRTVQVSLPREGAAVADGQEDAARFRLLENSPLGTWEVNGTGEGVAEWLFRFYSPYGLGADEDDLRNALDAAKPAAPLTPAKAQEQRCEECGGSTCPVATLGVPMPAMVCCNVCDHTQAAKAQETGGAA